MGADVIKITATGGVLSQQGRGLEAHFTNAEMQSIADTAHSLGLKVMAHAHGARGMEAAAAAGIDTIEHATFADEAALKVMKAKGTVMVPTLMALEGVRARQGCLHSDGRNKSTAGAGGRRSSGEPRQADGCDDRLRH
jgi:imidazolonepropionase-like amidohydrolase